MIPSLDIFPSNKRIYLPPTVLFVLLGLSILITSTVVVSHLLSQPWIGVSFDSLDQNKTGIQIKKITPDSPASNLLTKGQRIISIESVKNTSDKVILSPSILDFPLNLPTIDQYNEYLYQHKAISIILREDKIKLQLENNKEVILTPQKSRPFSSIPRIYQLLIMTNYIGLVIGMIVWTRNSNKNTGKLLLVMGFSYYMMVLPTILTLKEIAVLSPYFSLFSVVEHFFAILLGVCLMGLLMIYPNRIFPTYYMWVIAFLVSLFWMNATLQWADFPFHTYHLIYVFMYPIVFFFSYKQWISTKNEPLKRAACSAFLLPVFIFAVTTVTLFIIPLVFVGKPLLSTEFAKLLLGATFFGFAISILQYRLFDVEEWWFKTWLWLLSGLLIIVMDLLLVYFFQLKQITALGIAVVAIGFVYFPFRQWLFQHLLPQSEKALQEYIPIFTNTVSDNINSQGFENGWKQVIQERYSPVNIEHNKSRSAVQLADNGLVIHVPDTSRSGHYQLTGKSGGLRLFNNKDCNDITALHSLMTLINQTSQKHHSLIMKERSKIMQDMHDTVGSNLLTLSQRIKNPVEAEYITQTLQVLRDTIHLSTSETPLWLEEIIADLRIEAMERCELENVDLSWQSDSFPDEEVFSTAQSIALINIFREAISNALRHASPSKIGVRLSHHHNALDIIIKNNGEISEWKEWKEWKYGHGLDNMKSRTEKLKGEFLVEVKKGYVMLNIKIPLRINDKSTISLGS